MQVAANRWFVVSASAELSEKPLGMTRMGRDIVLWRDGEGQVRGALDVCPHAAPACLPGTTCAPTSRGSGSRCSPGCWGD